MLLGVYTTLFQLQIRRINCQLSKRLNENTRQPVSLELINSELNTLAININKCLKAEENLRLESIREEKHFKEMIANISHDLRTPLTAIKGYQQLIIKGNLAPDQYEKLLVAQKHADELGNLIEHFFEYSYLLNADIKPNLGRINLVSLSAECLAESVAILEEKNLAVQFEEDKPVFVVTDKEMTARIIQNLIRNCAIHSSGNIKVQVIERSNSGIISFSNPVNNATEVDTTRIFERFYTGDKSRTKTTGLGLSIVKLLAEQLNGTVSAELQGNILEIQVQLPLCHK
jgi:signal transduction histidine kinase